MQHCQQKHLAAAYKVGQTAVSSQVCSVQGEHVADRQRCVAAPQVHLAPCRQHLASALCVAQLLDKSRAVNKLDCFAVCNMQAREAWRQHVTICRCCVPAYQVNIAPCTRRQRVDHPVYRLLHLCWM